MRMVTAQEMAGSRAGTDEPSMLCMVPECRKEVKKQQQRARACQRNTEASLQGCHWSNLGQCNYQNKYGKEWIIIHYIEQEPMRPHSQQKKNWEAEGVLLTE